MPNYRVILDNEPAFTTAAPFISAVLDDTQPRHSRSTLKIYREDMSPAAPITYLWDSREVDWIFYR